MAARILVSWIGNNDLAAMARDSSEEVRNAVKTGARLKSLEGVGRGPLRTAIYLGDFDQIHLLTNYPKEVNGYYRKWLGRSVKLHEVSLTNPTDHGEIVAVVDRVMRGVYRRDRGEDWFILLTPGTPSMAAIWVLLGKSRYLARFYQTFDGKLTESVIPYDLLNEYVPEVLRAPDEHLQRLAATGTVATRGFEDIIGESRVIRAAKGLAARAAIRDVSVLLLGESGTGKEEFARAIHKASRRRDERFLAVNCGAIPKELQESELFGHVKGAFTGADRERPGAFAAANGGTLFLDEIGECPLPLQVKLLRVLQPPTGKGPCHRSFEMVGGKSQTSDVRVIAATNRDMATVIAEGRFREDLYYRLNVLEIGLPPLRARGGDLPLLADHLLAKVNSQFKDHEPGYQHKLLSAAAKEFLVRCPWPGNVRQLHNVLVRAAVLADGEVIELADLETAVGAASVRRGERTLEHPLGNGFNLEDHLDEIRRHYLRRAMLETKGIKSKAYKLLGLKHYQTLSAQLERLGVESDASESTDD